MARQARLRIDASPKLRRGGRIRGATVAFAAGVTADGRREVSGMAVGASEAEPVWVEFPRGHVRRGLAGVKRAISDAQEGVEAAKARALSTTGARTRASSKECADPCPARSAAASCPTSSPPLRPARSCRSQGPIASGRRPEAGQGAGARHAHGDRRGGRARPYDLSPAGPVCDDFACAPPAAQPDRPSRPEERKARPSRSRHMGRDRRMDLQGAEKSNAYEGEEDGTASPA